MARLLRIESCYNECSECWYDDDSERFICTASDDPDRPGYNREIPRDRTEPPDWCPLPEAGGWIPVGERTPTERGTYEVAMPPLSQNEQHPNILVCEWAPAYGFYTEVLGTTFVYNANVIAWRPWQPLPSLPEEATNAE